MLPSTWSLYMHEITMVTRCAAHNWCGYFGFLTVTKNIRKVEDKGRGIVRDIALKSQHMLFCAFPLQPKWRAMYGESNRIYASWIECKYIWSVFVNGLGGSCQNVSPAFCLHSVCPPSTNIPQKGPLLASITEMRHITKTAIPRPSIV